jgi:Cu+-exporting ATPase
VPVYFEASAAVITLVLVGKLLESRAKARTLVAIEALARLVPKTARVERDGLLVEIDAAPPMPGDVFIVRPGESVPVSKRPGGRVFAAMANAEGMLRCRATGVGEHTLLAGIIRLEAAAVSRRQSRKPFGEIPETGRCFRRAGWFRKWNMS